MDKITAFYPNDCGPEATQRWKAWRDSIALISKKVNFEVDLRIPVSPRYDLVISLYSNLEYATKALDHEEQADVANLINKEFGVERPLMWHYDTDLWEGTWLPVWQPPSAEHVETLRGLYKDRGVTLICMWQAIALPSSY